MIWVQLTTTVAEVSAWGPSQIIALAAAMGTILAVAVTGVSIYFTYKGSNKRLRSEESRHTERLANERRLLHEGNAAKAYGALERVQRWVQLDAVAKAAALGQNRLSREHKEVVMAAVDAITEAKAYAWRDEMVTAAGWAIMKLVELEQQTDTTIRVLAAGANDRDPGAGKRAQEKFQERWSAYDNAIENFRKEITK